MSEEDLKAFKADALRKNKAYERDRFLWQLRWPLRGFPMGRGHSESANDQK